MRLIDYDKLFDDPSASIASADVPIIWYDYRNEKLAKAFNKLRRRRNALAKRSRPRPLRRAWVSMLTLLVVIGPTLSYAFEHQDALVSPWIVLGCAIGLIAAPGIRPLRKKFAQMQFRKLAESIRRGDFGQAVMFNIDPAWEELDAALQTHEKGMRWVIANNDVNKAASKAIAVYLTQTQVQRGMLRVRATLPPHDHSALLEIRQQAAIAADRIMRAVNRANHPKP